MATNILSGVAFDRRARVYYLATALGATTTTAFGAATATDLKTQREKLARNTRGKLIPKAFAKSASGSSANFALKLQTAKIIPGVAEASWDWQDLVSFTAIATDGGTYEEVELTKPVLDVVRMVATRTGGTVTGLEVGYFYAQQGPRGSYDVFQDVLAG